MEGTYDVPSIFLLMNNSHNIYKLYIVYNINGIFIRGGECFDQLLGLNGERCC